MTDLLKTLRETQQALHEVLRLCNERTALTSREYVTALQANQAAVDAILEAERHAAQPKEPT